MGRKSLTLEEFIKRAVKAHGNKYNYSLVNYVNNSTKVTILCKDHGEFKQKPNDHFNGSGCPKCANFTISNTLIQRAKKVFVKKAQKVHGVLTYTYEKVQYKNTNEKVLITCPIHGDFWQSPHSHLNQRSGCVKCGKVSMGLKQVILGRSTFIERANSVHGKDTYNYQLVDYQKSDQKVSIICPKHGIFLQTPSNHLQGGGCPACARKGFNTLKIGILYYIKIGNLYKIGITNKSIEERYSLKERKLFDDYKTWKMSGEEAYETEQAILKVYKEFKYLGEPVLKIGNTELFTCDVLNCF